MNILYVVGDKPHEWNSSEWRCAIPSRALAAVGHRTAMMNDEDFNKSIEEQSLQQRFVGPYNLIFYQRNMGTPEAFTAARYWQMAGRAVVVDLDDGYTMLPPTNEAWRFWYDSDDSIGALRRMRHKTKRNGQIDE